MEHVFPTIDLKATGRRIRELREQRGISVRQLQAFLGFEQPQAIYKWQRGECLPTFDNMYAMACFFHVKVDEILVGNRQDFDIFWLQRIPHGWSATQFPILWKCRIAEPAPKTSEPSSRQKSAGGSPATFLWAG